MSSAKLISGLYAITDTDLIPHEALLENIEQALKGGARILQYRDKQPGSERRLAQASAIHDLCKQYGVPLLINDDIDLAVQCQAEGVHLGQNDASIPGVRQKPGEKAIIGITCHDSLALALNAQQQGADYIAFGRFFPSFTKPKAPPAPLKLLELARPQLQIPMVAIGGITVDNARQVIQRGADAIAVIHHLFSTDNIEQRAHQLGSRFHSI